MQFINRLIQLNRDLFMSLIKCPECKKTISSTVETCPHCGYKLSAAEKEIALADAEINPPSIDEKPQQVIVNQTPSQTSIPEDEGSSGGGFALGFFLGLIGLIIAACVGKKNTKSGAVSGFIVQAIIGLTIWLVTMCASSGSYYY